MRGAQSRYSAMAPQVARLQRTHAGIKATAVTID